MHLYNESTTRRSILRAQINWSRELTFSSRQNNYILSRVPHARGVYCIYAKDRLFPYEPPHSSTKYWNPVVYIGSGWLDNRLCTHLREQRKRCSQFVHWKFQSGISLRSDFRRRRIPGLASNSRGRSPHLSQTEVRRFTSRKPREELVSGRGFRSLTRVIQFLLMKRGG